MGERDFMIYLDNCETTKMSSKVEETLHLLMKEQWKGKEAFDIEKSMTSLYELVGAEREDQFVFTSSEREAARLVCFSVLCDHITKTGKNHLLTSCIDNASLLQTMNQLEKVGCETHYIPLNEEGIITPEAVEEAINPRTSMLALSWVNGLTGVIQPIWEIAKVCKKYGVLVYVQASEIFAKLAFRFSDLDIDFLSFTSEKFHGPKGAGGLFVKKEIDFPSLQCENQITNLPGFIAMGVAAKEVLNYMDGMGTEVARLRAEFEDQLVLKIPEIVFFGQNASRVPNTTCFTIPGIHSDVLLFYLKEKEVYASSGGGERQRLESILASMGVKPLLAKGAISCSLSMFTTESEIEKAVEGITFVANELKKAVYV